MRTNVPKNGCAELASFSQFLHAKPARWGEESTTRTSTEAAVEAEAAAVVVGDEVEVAEEDAAVATATALLAAEAMAVMIPTLHARVATMAARIGI